MRFTELLGESNKIVIVHQIHKVVYVLVELFV